jgi:hypothetical protein
MAGQSMVCEGRSTVRVERSTMRVGRSTMRVCAAVWLAGLLAALLGPPAAAVAAGATKHPATAAKGATSAPATASPSPVPSPSGGGSLGGGLTAPGGIPTTTSTTPTVISTGTASTSGSSGLSGGSAIAIAIGAFVVIAGISYYIWHDARRRAPVAVRADEDRQNRPGSRAPPKARKLSAAERKRRKRGRAKR